MDKKYIIIIAILIIISGIFASLIIYEKLTGVNRIEPLGIASENIIAAGDEKETAQVITPVPIEQETQLAANCDAFPDMLSSCTKYKCQFIHPLTEETMEKEILGMIDGKCNYVEQMPGDGKMECKYTESVRKTAAQYYKDIEEAESSTFETNINLGTGEQKTKYTIDGKEVENPMQEAIDTGICIILGY